MLAVEVLTSCALAIKLLFMWHTKVQYQVHKKKIPISVTPQKHPKFAKFS